MLTLSNIVQFEVKIDIFAETKSFEIASRVAARFSSSNKGSDGNENVATSSGTMALRVRCTFWYISSPFSLCKATGDDANEEGTKITIFRDWQGKMILHNVPELSWSRIRMNGVQVQATKDISAMGHIT